MKPAPFEYHAPESLGDVTALLAEHGDDAKVLAGGQSLVPMLALRLTRFEHIIDLNRVDDLSRRLAHQRHAHGEVDDDVSARSSTTPPPARPCRCSPRPSRSSVTSRSATAGRSAGSIAHADPASELPAVALALDAELEVAGPGGTRRSRRPTSSSAPGPPPSATTRSSPAVHFPVWSGRAGFAVEEVARRSGDFALAGVVAAVELDDAGAVHGRASRSSAWRPRRCGRAPPSRRWSGRRRRDRARPRSAQLAVARHRTDGRRPRVGRVPQARRRPPRRARPRSSPGSSASWLTTPSSSPSTASRAQRALRGAQDTRRLPARGLRSHRHAPRVRARRLRRVHDPASTARRCARA